MARDGVAGGGLVATDGLAQGVGGGLLARERLADLRQLAGERGRALLVLAHRLDAGAQPVGLLLEVVETAAVVAGQALGGGALDGDGGELLADGVGAALDLLDALERAGELAAGGFTLALAVALQPRDRLAELDASGLRGLLVLGADLLELIGDVDATGEAGFEAAGGLGDRLGRTRLGGRDGLGQARVGQRLGGRAVALELVETGGQAGGGGLGGGQRLAARSLDLVALEAGALEPLEAGELLDAVELTRDSRQRTLEIGAQRLGGTIGLGGAALGLAAGLLELRGQAARDALELVDALDRAQQPGDDRGGVVELVEAALDARVEVGQPLLGLRVGGFAGGLAAGQLGLDPRGRGERLEDDERAGGAPALPGLDLGLERRAQRAHDDRVLLAHAQQHQVQRQLEGEVLQEEREVEALVELDGDEDRLHREAVAVGAAAGQRDRAGDARRLAEVEELAPGLTRGRNLAADQGLEEALAEDVLGRLVEQQLGRLGPLGDRPLPVRQDEVPADDLTQQCVKRIGHLGHHGVDRGGRGVRRGVHQGSPGSGQRRVLLPNRQIQPFVQ